MTVPANRHSLRPSGFHLFHPSNLSYFLSLGKLHKDLIGMWWVAWMQVFFMCVRVLFRFFVFFLTRRRDIFKQSKHAAFHVMFKIPPPVPPFHPLSLRPVSSLHHLSEFISFLFLSLLFTSAPSHLALFAEVMSSLIVHHSQTSKEEKE